MPPKAAGVKGGAEVLIHEDCFTRATKLKEANVKPGKPKGDLTAEDFFPYTPGIQSMPDFKPAVAYFGTAMTVKYAERENFKWPTDARFLPPLGQSASEPDLARRNKKEVQDMFKFLKGQVKQAEKAKKNFFKQYSKCEGKCDKKKVLEGQIKALEDVIDSSLREADECAKKTRVFQLKYMFGSKLDKEVASDRVAIVMESSDKMAPYLEAAKNDVNLLIPVLERDCASFNTFLFSSAGITPYQPVWTPTFPDPNNKKSKKGSQDCLKWINKQYNPKAMAGAPWPPDWLALVEALCKENPDAEKGGVGMPTGPLPTDPWELPNHIYIVCSKVPIPCQQALDRISQVRLVHGVDLPVTIITYEPETEGDFNQECFFKDFAGAKGRFELDTSKRDMENVDKILGQVKKDRKKLDKLGKKLAKMEAKDGPTMEKLEEFGTLFQQQNSLELLARNDFALAERAMKNPAA
jgi:hypothetical protein